MRRLAIERTWDGAPIGPTERAALTVRPLGSGLELRVEAPFHDDPAPPHAPGPTPGLWEHEVVELFVAGADERYLEIELGPRGHHLVLWLEGIRQPAASALPLDYEVRVDGARWTATARTGPQVPLPDPPWRVNAYVIHGVGAARRYLAHAPVPGERPDFHRLACFVPWDEIPDEGA